MKKRLLYTAILLTAGAGGVAALIHARTNGQPSAHAAPVSPGDGVIAAIGRVEPITEEVKIGSQLAGVLRDVVEESSRLRKGAIIATLDNGEYAARVEAARATVDVRQAELDRIVNGARTQERREAAASIDEAKAVLANARSEMERRQSLWKTGDISRSEWEMSEREFRVAEARVQQSSEHFAFLDAPARSDDRARAEADVALARAQLRDAQAMLEKTIVRAPFNGTVLKRYRKTGESVSDKGDTPIVSFGDDSRLRVRVDVDETDVANLRPGDRAWFTAQAFGTQKFWGKVAQVGRELGKKNVQTDEPAEKLDTKVLETLVDLDGHPPLPAGLRVDSFILPGGRQ